MFCMKRKKLYQSVFLLSMSLAATAYAGCPDPSEIYLQKIEPEIGDPYLIDQRRYITKYGWISDNGVEPVEGADIKLVRVDIANLGHTHHGLACVYSMVDQPAVFKMYEPAIESSSANIKLSNPSEWTSLSTDEHQKYGYTCTTSETIKCEFTTSSYSPF